MWNARPAVPPASKERSSGLGLFCLCAQLRGARVLGDDHPDTLTTRGNLAFWRGETGDAGAAEAFEQLLTDRLRILGPDGRLRDLRARGGWTISAYPAEKEAPGVIAIHVERV